MSSDVAGSSNDLNDDCSVPFKKRRRRTVAAAKFEEAEKKQVNIAAKEVNSTDVVIEKEAETAKKETRRWETWNDASVFGFYEALKEHGKNFEAVGQFMAKKRCHKDYGQIRNFYYNSIKQLGTIVNLSEYRIPKEAKELFLLINYEEWRKKTGRPKVNKPEKFRELVMKGITSVKVKGKVKKETLKTPACAALKKYCIDVEASLPKVPAEIIFELIPRTYEDKAYVISCEQNPFVRLRLGPNELLKPYFTFLKQKWLAPELKLKADLLREEIDSKMAKIVIYPSSDMQLCEPTIRAKTCGPIVTCLDRCIDLCSKRNEDTKQTPKQTDDAPVQKQVVQLTETEPGTSGTTVRDDVVNVESGTENSNDAPTVPTDDDNSRGETVPNKEEPSSSQNDTLTLDSWRVRAGINEDNVGGTTAGELSLICRLQSTLRFLYSIETKTKDKSMESWHLLMTLIMRGYGEELHKALNTTAQKQSNAKNDSNKMTPVPVGSADAAAALCQGFAISVPSPVKQQTTKPPPRKRKSKKSEQTQQAPTQMIFPMMPGSNPVEDENRMFMLQVQQQKAQAKRRKGTSVTQNVVRRQMVPQENTSFVVQQAQPQITTIVLPTSWPMTNVSSSSDTLVVPTTQQFIPISQAVHQNPNLSIHQQQQPLICAPQVSEPKTPDKNQRTEPIVLSALSSPGLTALLRDMSADGSNDNQATDNNRQIDFSNLNNQPSTSTHTQHINFDHLLTSPPKMPNFHLPNDVRLSFDQMMQQNSVDFCRNFEALAETLETPNKTKK